MTYSALQRPFRVYSTRLVCSENTHNRDTGRIQPDENVVEIL